MIELLEKSLHKRGIVNMEVVLTENPPILSLRPNLVVFPLSP